MPVKQLIFCVITIVCAVLKYNLSRSNRMQIDFPVNGKECQRVRELIQNKRIHLTMEERSTTFESIENANFSDYINLLLDQHKNSDKSIQDFIARIPFTEHSQFLFPWIVTGWRNSYSLTLIAHKKYDGHHKILISKLSRELTMSIWMKIFSPLKSLFGMTTSEHEQIDEILAGKFSEQNKQMLENMMLYVMAGHINTRFSNDIQVDFVDK